MKLLCLECHDHFCPKYARIEHAGTYGYCDHCGKGRKGGGKRRLWECHQYDMRQESAERRALHVRD